MSFLFSICYHLSFSHNCHLPKKILQYVMTCLEKLPFLLTFSMEAYQEFVKLRTRLNKFFMRFVSELVFLSEPCVEVIDWLANCVTFRGGTRQFSMFNCEDVVDPDPVLRSFLLKLLLKCKNSERVRGYLDKIITQREGGEGEGDRKSTRLNSSHVKRTRMTSSA